MQFSILPIVFGVGMALLDVIMMSTVKQVTRGALPVRTGIPFAVLVYALEPLLFWQSMVVTGESMTIMNLVWDLTSDIMVTLLGIFWFGEKVVGLRVIGVFFSLVALTIFATTDAS
jgi:hypothetical protein